MKKTIEIFRGAGALAAFEAATIRALLEAAGIPVSGGRMKIQVAASDYSRARKMVTAAFQQSKPSAGRTAKAATSGA